MDKQTLSNYGWVVVSVLVISIMLALATPFGTYVGTGVKNTFDGLFETQESAMEAVGLKGKVDSGTTIVFNGKSYPVVPGAKLYDETTRLFNEEGYYSVDEYTLSDLDVTTYCVDGNGRILNLKETRIEKGRTYEFVYTNFTVNVSIDDIPTGNYKTMYINLTDSKGTPALGYVPIICGMDDTILNVMHAIFPSYFYASAKEVESAEQEHLRNTIVGYHSGQDIGCGTTNSHVFFGIKDKNGIFMELDTPVTHMGRHMAICFAIEEEEMSYEDAKAKVLSELDAYYDGFWSEECKIKLETPYVYVDNEGTTTEYIFYRDGSLMVTMKDEDGHFGTFITAGFVKFENGHIIVDGETYTISDNGSTLHDEANNLTATAKEITKGEIVYDTMYEYSDGATQIFGAIFNADGSITVYENGEITMQIPASYVMYNGNHIAVAMGGELYNCGIHPDGTKVVFDGIVLSIAK